MATTVNRSLADCAQRVVKRDPLAELDETIAYYAGRADEASRHQVRRLRRIRAGMAHPDGTAPVTVACFTQR